jgi:hypothetical protein
MQGGICVLKKDGTKSEIFTLMKRRCLIGRSLNCDIRIKPTKRSLRCAEYAEIYTDDNNEVSPLTASEGRD